MGVPIQSIAAAAAVAFGSGTTAPLALQDEQPPTPAKNVFNPQISLVTDFRGILVDNHGEKVWNLNELELGFAADVDPFLRAEAYIGIHQHTDDHGHKKQGKGKGEDHAEYEIEIEEAFAVYNRLGGGWQVKMGKFAGAVGRLQRNHIDQLNFLDYPFVIQDLFGEHGLRAPGVHVSYLFPGQQFLELSLEAVQAEDGPLFDHSTLDKPVGIARLRTFFDFSEDMSAQLGGSLLFGPRDEDRATVVGLDYTMKWQPGQKGRSAVLETEAYWANSNEAGFSSTFGAFAAFTYEVAPRTFITARYDYSEMPGTSDLRQAWGANVSYKLTEFQVLRLEFQRITSNFDDPRNVLTFQFQYLIGAHPAHKY